MLFVSVNNILSIRITWIVKEKKYIKLYLNLIQLEHQRMF